VRVVAEPDVDAEAPGALQKSRILLGKVAVITVPVAATLLIEY
jgi:hypothetical protein